MFCHDCVQDFQSRRGFRRHKQRYPHHERCEYSEPSEPEQLWHHDLNALEKFYRLALMKQQPDRQWDNMISLQGLGVTVDEWRDLYMDRTDAMLWTVYRQERGQVVWAAVDEDTYFMWIDDRWLRKHCGLEDRHIDVLLSFLHARRRPN